MNLEISKQALQPFIMFNEGIPYHPAITLYPVKMKNIIEFQQYQMALTVRKNSIFHDKDILKADYWDFIKYACRNGELAAKYDMPLLPFYYDFILGMLQLCCGSDAVIQHNTATLDISINDVPITNKRFDDIRKIIIMQNDIDFDIDEFINIDTIRALEHAKEFEAKKHKEKSEIEDYIDSLIISMNVTEEYVSNMTIRKFWRYIKRINKHEEYTACRAGEMSGMVTFKEPVQHWMTSIESIDEYENLKTDEDELRSKIE